MFERILLPLDGSPLAEAVLSHVAPILRRKDSEVLLLRVSPSPVTIRGQSSPFTSEEKEVAECYVNDIARRLVDEGIRVRAAVESGAPAPSILDVAARERITLIALSTHGRSGLTRWVFGSVAEKVIRASPIPLLVIRSFRGVASPIPLAPIPFRTLLVPIAAGFLRIVPFVMEFAQLFQSKVVLLHILEPESGAPEEVEEELKRVGKDLQAEAVATELVQKSGDPAHEILQTCEEVRADLVAMSTHGRDGLSRWALGSVTEKVLRAAPVPMLIVRNS
jgi:nucleotide-binding universal stress UspA family protein